MGGGVPHTWGAWKRGERVAPRREVNAITYLFINSAMCITNGGQLQSIEDSLQIVEWNVDQLAAYLVM